MPYREMPRGASARPDDSAEVATVFQHRDRFGRLGAAGLWPAPAASLFHAQHIRAFAVSSDGKRALLCSNSRAWLLDTDTMVAQVSIALPTSPDVCALNADGSRAALVCNQGLYRWDIGATVRSLDDLPQVWNSRGLYDADILELSADGRVAVTSRYSRRAVVRVYDVEALTMTHSFVTDSDECLVLHPNGRHLICFGDDKIGRFYGREGLYAQLKNCTGGAISPDGKTLCINDLAKEEELRVHTLDASGPTLRLGPERRISLGDHAKRWDFQARFSPGGAHILVAMNSGLSRVPLDRGPVDWLSITMERKTAILADESRLLSSGSAADFGVDATAITLRDSERGHVQAMLCSAHGDPERLVAVSPIGVHGAIDGSAEPIGEAATLPYERPLLMSCFLAEGGLGLDREEQLRLSEVQERLAAWQRHVSGLTADITLRQLIAVNRGLLEMTPEIVHRARTATNHPDTPRFGPHQVSLGALKAAAMELSQLSLGVRQEAFSKMVNRMRSGLDQNTLAQTGKESLDLNGEETGSDTFGVVPSCLLPQPSPELSMILAPELEPEPDMHRAEPARAAEPESSSHYLLAGSLFVSVVVAFASFWLILA